MKKKRKKKGPRPIHNTRRAIQLGFLALTVVAVFTLGANAERWCPMGGVEALYTYVQEGNLTCSLGVSNFYILGGVLALTLVLRRSFCGYMCPIGAVSEMLQGGAKRLGIKPARVPRRLDSSLALLKYPILALILFFTWRTAELVFRGYDPCYALISRHGEDITFWAYVVSGGIVVASLFLTIPFCRWLCPLAAVLNPFSRFSFGRIRRHEEVCTGCKLCDTNCPMAIPVAEVQQVTHARCIGCMECVESCPSNAQGSLSLGSPRTSARPWSQPLLISLMLAIVSVAVGASYAWPLPSFHKSRGDLPAESAQVELSIQGLKCRGSSNQLWYFLERDDFGMGLEGPLLLEAWPGPGFSKAVVHYDPELVTEEQIKSAITEPLMDEDPWRLSPFEIEGYDPYGLGDL